MKSALENEGITVVMLDKTSSPYINLVPGDIELLVHDSQAEQAIEFVIHNESSL